MKNKRSTLSICFLGLTGILLFSLVKAAPAIDRLSQPEAPFTEFEDASAGLFSSSIEDKPSGGIIDATEYNRLLDVLLNNLLPVGKRCEGDGTVYADGTHSGEYLKGYEADGSLRCHDETRPPAQSCVPHPTWPGWLPDICTPIPVEDDIRSIDSEYPEELKKYIKDPKDEFELFDGTEETRPIIQGKKTNSVLTSGEFNRMMEALTKNLQLIGRQCPSDSIGRPLAILKGVADDGFLECGMFGESFEPWEGSGFVTEDDVSAASAAEAAADAANADADAAQAVAQSAEIAAQTAATTAAQAAVDLASAISDANYTALIASYTNAPALAANAATAQATADTAAQASTDAETAYAAAEVTLTDTETAYANAIVTRDAALTARNNAFTARNNALTARNNANSALSTAQWNDTNDVPDDATAAAALIAAQADYDAAVLAYNAAVTTYDNAVITYNNANTAQSAALSARNTAQYNRNLAANAATAAANSASYYATLAANAATTAANAQADDEAAAQAVIDQAAAQTAKDNADAAVISTEAAFVAATDNAAALQAIADEADAIYDSFVAVIAAIKNREDVELIFNGTRAIASPAFTRPSDDIVSGKSIGTILESGEFNRILELIVLSENMINSTCPPNEYITGFDLQGNITCTEICSELVTTATNYRCSGDQWCTSYTPRTVYKSCDFLP